MDRKSINRITEAFAVLCLVAAVVTLVLSGRTSPVEGSLAGLTVQTVSDQDMAGFQSLLGDARRLVDTNRDPELLLERLKESFPGRHEVWALGARYYQSRGDEAGALTSYSRAVRLEPDYLDEKSGLFLGKRIDKLTAKVLADLTAARSGQDLDSSGKELLKTAYFLKRRLAGGCE